MDHPTRVVSIDWISRLLAFISILAAAFAIAVHFSKDKEAVAGEDVSQAINKVLADGNYVDQESLKAEIRSVMSGAEKGDSSTGLSEETKKLIQLAVAEELKNRDDLANEDIKKRIAQFQKDADSVIDIWEKNLDRFYLSAENEFERIRKDGLVALRPNSDDSDPQPTPAKGSPDNQSPNDASVSGIARVTMKPVERNERLVRIVNDSDQLVRIDQVSFTPEAEFQKLYSATKTSSRVKTLVLLPEHNTATKAGYHATYIMPLDKAISIPANDSVYIRLRIQNSEHHQFGFLGTLKVDYEDGSSQVAKNVKVDFTK